MTAPAFEEKGHANVVSIVDASAVSAVTATATAGEAQAPVNEAPIVVQPRILSKREILQRELIVSSLVFVLIFLLRLISALPVLSDREVGISYFLALIHTLASVTVMLFGARSVWESAIRSVRSLVISIDFCEAAALGIVLVAQVYGLFASIDELVTQPLYYSPIALAALIALARYTDTVVQERQRLATGIHLNELAPQVRAIVGDPGKETLQSAATAAPGTNFVVSAGEIVPLDAEITTGKAEVAEQKLGGVSNIRFKSPGQQIFAGSLVRSGSVECTSASAQEDSVYETFLSGLNNSVAEEMKQDKSSTFASLHSLALIFIAACGALFWHDRGASILDIANVLAGVLLMGLFPRLLRISASLRGATLTKLFKLGITLKDGGVIRSLSKLRTLIFEYDSLAQRKHLSVPRFEIIDQRIDEGSLVSVLLTLLGDSEEEFAEKSTALLRQRIVAPLLFEVTGYRAYPGKGFIGTVQGMEFSVGGEEFLIQRGVQLQASDVQGLLPGQWPVYVAMNEEVVAKFVVSDSDRSDEREAIEKLGKEEVHAYLCGEASAESVDTVAREIGLELPYSYGGVQKADLLEKLDRWGPSAYYTSGVPDVEIQRSSAVKVTHFDDVRWNERETEVTLYTRSIANFAEAVSQSKWCERMRGQLLIPGGVLSAALLASAFFGVFSPALIILTVAAAASAAALIAA